eukprot:2393398-Rhodomonas_salina.4
MSLRLTRIVLRVCHAKPGTDSVWCYQTRRGRAQVPEASAGMILRVWSYALAMRCPVLIWAMMTLGIDVGYTATHALRDTRY